MEGKRLLTHTLKLQKERHNDADVARALMDLSEINRTLRLCKEGIQQAKEALEIFERLGNTRQQAGVRIASLCCCVQTINSTLQKKSHLVQSNFSQKKAKNL
jgi:hypothetical protein